MKNYCISLLACVALLGAGCTQGNVPEDLTRLDGLFGLTTAKSAPADGRYEEYVRFYADNTFEYFFTTTATYVYHVGTYSIRQGELTLRYKGLRRFDMADDLPRLTDSYYAADSQDQSVLIIKDYAEEKITLKTSSGRCYLYHTTQLYGWNDEFSAPDVPVTADALLAQWDQLDFYQYSWQGSTWWYFFEPDKNGMTLAADGMLTYCPFWANRVLEKMINAGKLTSSEQVLVEPADCAWRLNGDTLTLACSRYLAYTPDAAGNRTAEHTEMPAEPVTIGFLVQTLTPYYLVLYNGETNLFHAFYRHRDTPSSAPRRSSSALHRSTAAPHSPQQLSVADDMLLPYPPVH